MHKPSGATSISSYTPSGSGSLYFLVVPLSGFEEGSYGQDSDSNERPISGTTCKSSQDLTACP